MKKLLNSLIVLLISVLFSCSSSHSSTDSDILPDSDSDELETIANDDTDSEEDSDFIDDSDETPDQDADSDTIPDTDSDECQPPLSEAPFPYYDANGKITFCRPGCDIPTADDPICIGNLWDEQNEKLCPVFVYHYIFSCTIFSYNWLPSAISLRFKSLQ